MTNTCSCCNKEGKLFFTFLPKGGVLCSKCMSILPKDVQEFAQKYWGLKEYNNFKAFINFDNQTRASQFKETHKFGSLSFDNINKLLKLKVNNLYLYLNIYYIDYIKIDYKNVKRTSLPGHAVGTVILQINIPELCFSITEGSTSSIINNNAYTLIKNGTAQFPKKLEILYSVLNLNMQQVSQAYAQQSKKNQEQKKEEQNETFTDQSSNTQELRDAMTLFMIDSLEGLSIEQLKSQRNRLLKIYHPDEDGLNSNYAQKINDAFALLKNHIK